MRLLCLMAILAFSGCSDQGASAQTGTNVAVNTSPNWQMVLADSSVKFTAEYDGEDFEGSFSRFETQIKFNADDLASSKVTATIGLASVEAGEVERTEALPGKDWFFVKSFPKAVFESREFIHIQGNKYQAKGTLTLRGVTKDITLPFTLRIENDMAHMQGSFSLNRRDYDVGRGMWKSDADVGHNIVVNIIVNARKTGS